ncbi:FlgD immunoglobulin-like domain containing protein, partial [Candidatus Eisenbacteria bacterium]
RPIIASGPTTVERSFPNFWPDGHCVIQTEIVKLSLAGVYDPGLECSGGTPLPVRVDLDPAQPTFGTIVSSDDGAGDPDYPDDSQFNVNVLITVGGEGPYPHSVDLGNLLQSGDLWGDPPCVDPGDPYQPPSNDHAHIPCPPGDPPTGCCMLPAALGGGCFVTHEQICLLFGGNYLGDDVPCPAPPGACCFGGQCIIIPEALCIQLSGTYFGDGNACLPGLCHPAGPVCPHGGTDHFDETQAAFVFHVPGEPEPRPIIASGPTTVERSFPDFLPDGHCEIQTEIVELSLVGVYDPGLECSGGTPLPVTVVLDPAQPTLGTIISSDDGAGDPDYPDDSQFNVNVLITVGGEGPYPHSVDLGNLLQSGDLWGDPPCVDPGGPYQPPSNDHAHIPCPPGDPPTGCCMLPAALGGGCFVTHEQICLLFGGIYLGDDVPCPIQQGLPCSQCGPGAHFVDNCPGGLDVVSDHAALAGVSTDLDCVPELSFIMRPCPVPDNVLVVQRSNPLDDSANYPGLRPTDGHNDVIDTEILSMCLTASGYTLTAGAGQGQGGVLAPSLGAIAEKPSNPTVAKSFFRVYFEIETPGGQFLYNHTPLIIHSDITCLPPKVGYIHVQDCIPLFDHPTAGTHVANLTSADHVVNPGVEPAVCCLENDECVIATIDECATLTGLFHPESDTCDPNPCSAYTDVEGDPAEFRGQTLLFAAVPNPFTQTTVLKYHLDQPGEVTLDIYDPAGRLVRRLLDITATAGIGSVEWDGRNDAGRRVGRGAYFARLSAGGVVRSQRLITLE